MKRSARFSLLLVLKVLVCVLILKVTLSVMLGYRDYLPPDFRSDFLLGRQSYFFGPYQWSFYTHIASGPVTLILGLILINESFRLRFPKIHRALGIAQIIIVLFLLSPSGLWMAYYAATGAVAAIGFSVLAIVTGVCALLGWHSAVNKRFALHRRWMWRCYLLLCSAVLLRLIGGLARVADLEYAWLYPLAAWASWLVPLSTYELSRASTRLLRRLGISDEGHSAPSSASLSLPAMEIIARR